MPDSALAAPASPYSLGWRSFALALMRFAIGWHFLYEGFVKFLDPEWSAGGFLQASTGPLGGVFQGLAADPATLGWVNLLNVWGLMLIGAALVLGLFTRFAAVMGIALLGLYYLANPPWFGPAQPAALEGSYLLVNKNLVELLALAVVLFLPAKGFGLDGALAALWSRLRRGKANSAEAGASTDEPSAKPEQLSRRHVLAGLTGVPVLGGLTAAVLQKHGWKSFEEMHLAAQVDGRSGATLKVDLGSTLADLKGQLPYGNIGKVKLSRMILGGNLIGGWAHARDLIYVSSLVKAYHHRAKVFETFQIAEACGVNTILTNPLLCDVIGDYWKSTGGKIQFISDCGGKDVLEMIQKSIDNGACSCYVQGGIADDLVAQGKFDVIAQSLELIRKNGIPAGIGAHKLATVKACVEQGFVPDYWMKTLHHVEYWSARPGDAQKDNIWCEEPAETVAFMRERKEPWIAFKTLAAGAIHPRDGFRFAFQNGADFLCVGMYDFQIVDDVNIALDVLAADLKRERAWQA